MMIRQSIPLLLFGSLAAPTALAQPLQPQVNFTRVSATNWNAAWTGVAQRTYFIEQSVDLVNWSYAPIVEFGSGAKNSAVANQSAPKFFVRLRYVDVPWITTLQQARDADFDGDGVPNYFEVESLVTSPLQKNLADGDADGLLDGWEIFYFGNLTTANPAAIQSGDGLTNKDKSELGLSPNINYSDAAATQTAKFNYDLVGRLTGVTAPVGTAAYTPDEEGNLLNAQ
jgi:YD repeat-containing protein